MRRWLSWRVLLASGIIIQFTAYVGLPHVIADPDFASTGFWALWAFWVLGAWSAERFKTAQAQRTRPHRWRMWLVVAVCVGLNLVSLPWPFLAVLTVRSLVLATSVAIVLHDLMLREMYSDGSPVLSRALAWVGTRSYSLYATHAPVLAVAPAVAVFPVALVVYQWIERPSHSFARRAANPRASVVLHCADVA